MKSTITIPCPCGKPIPLEIFGSSLPKDAKCQACGVTIHLMDPLGNIVTMLLMERARQELLSGDITIATLLAAVAVEAEMAYLFFKWKGIGSQKVPQDITPEDRNQWGDEWANMRSIGRRLDELSRLLTEKPFDEFAGSNKKLLESALTDYKSAVSIKVFFQEQFFDKRNEIAHYGKIDFQAADGKQSFSLATALLNLLRAMDAKRYDLTFTTK
jgi:hypothetical protein